jgi:hypothetical protein
MLYGMKKKICPRGPVACCHSGEMLDIKMLSFEGKLQKTNVICVLFI